jgi:FKBP-type peptidyl-prolyl cis-trans isomerase SlyD
MIQVQKNTVVSIHYTLKNSDDILIQDTSGYSPESYLHGAGNILARLEEALTGKQSGDELEVLINYPEAFGPVDENLIIEVSNQDIPGIEDLQPGDFIGLPDGSEGILTEKHADFSVLDTNHPLAGEALVYNLRIVEVRPATLEEIQAGTPQVEAKACSGQEGCC